MARKNNKVAPIGEVIATRPILYEGRQFVAGEVLPCHDSKMVKAWLEAGSAKRKVEQKPDSKPEQKPDSKPEDGEKEE